MSIPQNFTSLCYPAKDSVKQIDFDPERSLEEMHSCIELRQGLFLIEWHIVRKPVVDAARGM